MLEHPFYFIVGAVNMALAIILGAFGSHVLKDVLDERMLNAFSTGVNYHIYHALGLLIIAILSQWINNSVFLKLSFYVMLTGILLFSGSLYGLSITGYKLLGPVTPIGGVLLISSWCLMVLAILK
jgi:uncharacterized membrane protein YgdD (TMEM256/DUF423 family)